MASRHFRPLLLACSALVACSPSWSAFAQSATATSQAATGDTELAPIVLKGKRVQKTVVSDSPLVSQTTAEELQEKQVDSFQDLGRSLEPGVDFLKSQGGVTIRGLGGPRVVTTIDGIPIPYLSNDARSGGPSTTTNANGGSDSFDFSSISALDVLRGADSSRLGSGALAGGIVLRTLEPDDLIAEGRDWGGMAKLTYDSEDNSFGGAAAVAKRVGNSSVLFQGAYKKGHEVQNQGDVDTIGPTRTETNPGDYDQSNVLLKARHELEGGHTIGFTAERYRRNFENDLKTLQGATTGSSRVYAVGNYDGFDDTARDRVSLDYSFLSPDEASVIDSAQFSIYWQRLVKNAGAEGARVGTFNGPWYRDNEVEDNAVGVTGSMTGSFDTGTLRHEVTVGGDFSVFGASQYLTGLDACVLGTVTAGCGSLHSNQSDMPDVDGKRLGIYVDDKISFGDSGFALTPGIRFDWYSYEPKLTDAYMANPGYAVTGLPDGSEGNRFSPKLLATYELTPAVELFAQWSMSYRAPTVNELYLDFANPASGYAVLGNADLKPETANGFEIGANFDTGDFTGRVAAFHNRYRNFIDIQTTYGNPSYPAFVQSNVNIDKVQISGVEFNAQKEFDNGLVLHGALAYAYGEDMETGDYVRSVAPFKGVVGVGYQQETWGTDLSLIASAGMRDDNKANTFDAPGYGIVDLTAWWEPEQVKGLRIQAGVYNLFDKKYWNAVANKDVNPNTVPSNSNTVQSLDYYSEAGRTFKISLIQKF